MGRIDHTGGPDKTSGPSLKTFDITYLNSKSNVTFLDGAYSLLITKNLFVSLGGSDHWTTRFYNQTDYPANSSQS